MGMVVGASAEPLAYLVEYVAIRRRFLRHAVDARMGIVVTLT